MKTVRVHNPIVAKHRKGRISMAKRKRRRHHRRRAAAANPRRRRRHVRRRRRNPILAARTRRGAATNPRRRRRHHRRRSNPSAIRIGEVLRDMGYGATGAILTRTGTGLVSGFVPAGLASSRLAQPVIKAVLATTVVRWVGAKFFDKRRGDIMMLGGLIDAGVDAINALIGDPVAQLTSIIRSPVQGIFGVPAQAMVPANTAGTVAMSDVEDVPASVFNGLGDVEDTSIGIGLGY